MTRFTGTTALVTGAGSGIGRAAATALADEGATVVLVGRTETTLRETAEVIGERATVITADVGDNGAVADAVSTAEQIHGRIDIAVNAAGVLRGGAVPDLGEDAWQDMLATNLSGVVHCLRHEVRSMRAHGGGVIVNVASNIGAHQRRAGMAGYVATKAAVSALTRASALDHIGDGVRINAVSPGPTDTAMSLRPGETPDDRASRLATANPSGRVGRLDEVTAAILWLASPESSYVVGTDLVVDGGASA